MWVATHIFAEKKINVYENTLAIFVINDLVKLTMLWTTGPWSLKLWPCYDLCDGTKIVFVNI